MAGTLALLVLPLTRAPAISQYLATVVAWTARALQTSLENYFLDDVPLSPKNRSRQRTSPITLQHAQRRLEIGTAHEHLLHPHKLRKCQHSVLSRLSRSQLRPSQPLLRTFGDLRSLHHRLLLHPASPQDPRSHPAPPKLCPLCRQLRRLAPKPLAWRRNLRSRNWVRRCNNRLVLQWSSPNHGPKMHL